MPKLRRGYLSPPVIIILALICLFVAATILFNTFLVKNEKNQPTPSASATQSAKPSSDETVYTESSRSANWKTYVNSKYGYSIKYRVDKFTNCSNEYGFYIYDGREGSRECALGEETPQLLIINKLDGTGKFQTSEQPECYLVQTENLSVAGHSAVKYTNKILSDKGNCNNSIVGGAKNNIHIVFYKNNLPYNIVYYENDNKSLIEQILQTFKFTN